MVESTEVLQYPVIFRPTGSSPGYTLKRWLWANQKMKDFEIWQYGVRQPQYSLPIPLAGHCVVKLDDRFVVFLGGATTRFDEFSSVIPNTGPEPTSHVHVYGEFRRYCTALGNNWNISTLTDLDNEVWATTFQGQDPNLKRMNVGRMNHGCVTYVEAGRTKIMVGGGVTKGRLKEK